MSQSIYGGTLTFNAARHHYAWNDTPLPGVTSILRRISKGDNLVQWSANMACQHIEERWQPGMSASALSQLLLEARKAWVTKRSDGADVGKEVHAYAEAVLKGEPRPRLTTDEAMQAASAFEEWLRYHHVKPLAIERRLMSKEHWFAGTTDLVAEIDGHIAIADFKTSSGIYHEYALQLAAYRMAWLEENGGEEPQRWIIRTDKKSGDFVAHQFRRHDLHERAFLACLELHRQMRDIEATEETAPKPQRKRKQAA